MGLRPRLLSISAALRILYRVAVANLWPKLSEARLAAPAPCSDAPRERYFVEARYRAALPSFSFSGALLAGPNRSILAQ